MSFPCTRCGACCKNIGDIEALQHFDRGDGVCNQYREGEGCLIYLDRPQICRIDEGFSQFKEVYPDKRDYYQANIEACNRLQKKLGLPEEFRVKQ